MRNREHARRVVITIVIWIAITGCIGKSGWQYECTTYSGSTNRLDTLKRYPTDTVPPDSAVLICDSLGRSLGADSSSLKIGRYPVPL